MKYLPAAGVDVKKYALSLCATVHAMVLSRLGAN